MELFAKTPTQLFGLGYPPLDLLNAYPAPANTPHVPQAHHSPDSSIELFANLNISSALVELLVIYRLTPTDPMFILKFSNLIMNPSSS